jgi:putative membrane protein
MTTIMTGLLRRFDAFVYGLWTLTLAYLLVSRQYMDFLRPEFGVLLALAQFITMGFMFSALFKKPAGGSGASGIAQSLVLIIPVVYLAVMPETMLGRTTFNTRFVGPTGMAAAPAESDDGTILTSQRPEPTLEASAAAPPKAAPTILDIFESPQDYIGHRVTVIGMILRDDNLKQHYGGHDTAVYRFLIYCCAADAMPLAIAVAAPRAEAFQKDQWVAVTGVFELQAAGDQKIPFLAKADITAIDPPKLPYLF